MGEWKAPLSLRVRQDLRAGLEEVAAREKRTLANIGEVILEVAARPRSLLLRRAPRHIVHVEILLMRLRMVGMRERRGLIGIGP